MPERIEWLDDGTAGGGQAGHNLPVKGFDFTPDVVAQVMSRAREQTKDWITKNQLLPGQAGTA